jgi:hypothetical protein
VLRKPTTLIAGGAALALIGAGIGIAAGLGAFDGGACDVAAPSASAQYVRPRVPPGVVLRQTARKIEQRVRHSLGRDSVITSVVVVAHRRETASLIGGTGPDIEHGGPAWIVRARGQFALGARPQCADLRGQQQSGYFVIDDKTGRTFASGFHS